MSLVPEGGSTDRRARGFVDSDTALTTARCVADLCGSIPAPMGSSRGRPLITVSLNRLRVHGYTLRRIQQAIA